VLDTVDVALVSAAGVLEVCAPGYETACPATS
jgi:hypothetical protein